MTNHAVLVGAGTPTITNVGPGTSNTVLLGNTGADPSFGQVPNAALVNSSITVTSPFATIAIGGSPVSLGGTLTLDVNASGFHWSDQAANFAAVKDNGYFIIGNATATLPAVPSEGDTISFIVDGAFTLTIQAAGGTTIQFATNNSSVNGTQVNTANGDSATIVFRHAANKWLANNFVGAWNFT